MWWSSRLLTPGLSSRNAPVVSLVLALVGLLFAASAWAAPFEPAHALFVGNGYYQQEYDIQFHLQNLGIDVTVNKDSRIRGNTDLSSYDLIIITEFAPNISSSGLSNIQQSGIPVLIVEYWDFWYSYRLGLTETEYCGYVGTDQVETVDGEDTADLLGLFARELTVYERPYTVYGISTRNISPQVTSLFYSSSSFGEVAVLYDEARSIISTGIYDTTRFTSQGWMLFDLLLDELHPIAPGWQNDADLWSAYWDSELASYIQAVERDPRSYTPQEIADEIWRRVKRWGTEELFPYITMELEDGIPPCEQCEDALDHLELFTPYLTTQPSNDENHIIRRTQVWPTLWPTQVATCSPTAFPGDPTVYCAEDLWFMGRNRGDPQFDFTVFDTYAFEDVVRGTDLGLSVQLGTKTLVYMGDTSYSETDDYHWGTPCPTDCAQDYVRACDDPISYIYNDTDPTNGINAKVYTQKYWENSTEKTGFRPLIIPGVHEEFATSNRWPLLDCLLPNTAQECLGWFNVPTGAATVNAKPFPFEPEIPTIALWYGAAVDNPFRATSWLAFSSNGIHFGSFPGVYSLQSGYGMFSDEKFIQVAPVTLTYDDLNELCSSPITGNSILCDLPHLDSPNTFGDDGMLLFGSGRRLRCSPLYLAFINFPHMGVAYYRNDGGTISWVNDESLATPISPHNATMSEAICDNPSAWSTDDHRQIFGELSVKLVKGTTPDEHHLVMLSNHISTTIDNDRVQYRTAHLDEPQTWSLPVDTTARGYGPYIIDQYTEVVGNSLLMYHLVSAWNGENESNGGEPYGVFSRPLKLAATNDFPVWPPQ